MNEMTKQWLVYINNDLITAKDKKLVNLLLFIDFKKAFDLVDSKLLINELKNIIKYYKFLN